MRDVRQIVADNGNDNRPGYDSHNLTGRAPKCGFCGDVVINYDPTKPVYCELCWKLGDYNPEGIAFND